MTTGNRSSENRVFIEGLLKDIVGFSKEGFLKVVHGEAIGFDALLVIFFSFARG